MNGPIQILIAVLNSLWQSAVVATLVWLALKFLPKINVNVNAATRYVIWWAALAVVLVLPGAPRIVAGLRARAQTPPAQTSNPLSSPVVTAPLVPETPAIVTLKDERSARWPLWILAAWAVLFLYRMTQILRSYLYLRGVKRRATASLQALPAIARSADLLLSTEIASPMAVGFLRPAVILPASLPGEIAAAELEHVLLHEAAHIARNDDWTNLAARLLGALLALHPVAILILRQIEHEREMACDDWVVARTGAARPYAASLARMFELRRSRRKEVASLKLAAGIFGGGSRVGERIETLLKRGREFSPQASLSRVALSSAVLLTFAIAGSLTPRWIAFAQQSPAPAFEVASVKPNLSGEDRIETAPRVGGRMTARNVPLSWLIKFAYKLQWSQISGGPGWVGSDRFDVIARAGDNSASEDQIRRMVRTLLADRFKLKLRSETREQPVYTVVVAKAGANGSPALRKAKDCAESQVARRAVSETPACPAFHISPGGQLAAFGSSMEDFSHVLSDITDRIVRDRTALPGRYNFRLTWTPDQATPGAAAAPSTELPGPSIFTAMQEQLGLRLLAEKGPVEVFVIDHAEKPNAN